MLAKRQYILFYAFALLLFSKSLFANENLIAKIYEALPSKLSKITLDKTTKKDLFALLGEAPKSDNKGNYFYVLSKIKYDTTIGLKDETVSFIFYKLPVGKLFLRDLREHIPTEILKSAYQSKNQNQTISFVRSNI